MAALKAVFFRIIALCNLGNSQDSYGSDLVVLGAIAIAFVLNITSGLLVRVMARSRGLLRGELNIEENLRSGEWWDAVPGGLLKAELQ